MAANDESFLSHFDIKINGAQAAPRVMHDLREVVVENSLHLPDMCTIRLHDEQFYWLDAETFKEGVKVEITGNGEKSPLLPLFYGEVTGHEMDLAAHGVPTILIRCLDRSHRLHRGRSTMSFVQMKDSDIVQKVGGQLGFTVHADETSQVHEWVLQNNMTPWEFLTERARYNGFRLYLQNEKDLYFQKVKEDGSGDVELEWGKTLRSFRPRTSAAPQVSEVVVRGWDPATKKALVGSCKAPQDKPQVGDGRAGGAVADEAYGGAKMIVVDRPVHSQGEADDLARSVCDDIGGAYLEAEGLCFGEPKLKPGMMVSIKNIGKKFSGKYFVTVTTHTFTPAEGYSTQFTVNGKSPSTLLSLLDGSSHSHRAKLGGNIVVGVVTDNVDPENLGRVKVMYPWLTEDHTSYWIRMSSPMGGPDRGFYFLPEVDDEVLVAFEHGDIRRAYLLGVLWNGKDKPIEGNSTAVLNKQVVRRTIKTRIGHTILLDDTDKKGEMSLTTCSSHKLTLDDKNKNILAQTKDGHKVLLDDQNNQVIVTDKAGNKMTINTGDNSIKLECKGNFTVEAQGKVSIQGQMGVDVTTPAQLKIDGTAGVDVHSSAMLNLGADGPAKLESSAIVTVQGSLVKIN